MSRSYDTFRQFLNGTLRFTMQQKELETILENVKTMKKDSRRSYYRSKRLQDQNIRRIGDYKVLKGFVMLQTRKLQNALYFTSPICFDSFPITMSSFRRFGITVMQQTAAEPQAG